jgi:surfeit locus 1 family protein
LPSSPWLCSLRSSRGALGTWQLQRRVWKLDLIERVEARVHAPAVAAPARVRWPGIDAASDEYRHVQASGTYLRDADTFVQAVTTRGAGFWVLTPLQLADGSVLLVNRGFVPPEARAQVAPPIGPVTVTGLLRLTEPRGGFLRRNDAAADRWFSRDVQAIGAARGLANLAPYFVDADAGPADAAPPAGGLTVVAFANNHLVYAITWYTLALMVAAAAWRLIREERRAGHD